MLEKTAIKPNKSGYIRLTRKINGERKLVFQHRLIWEAHKGAIPQGYEIHHINGDRLDNRIDNLQLIDRLSHRRITVGWKFINEVWHKPCKGCNELKEFNTDNYHIKKSGSPHHLCKPCRSKYVVRWSKRNA